MASVVAEALGGDSHAVVQAGTGTGKSLAYLVPAVLGRRRVVIATATKALQDQLAGKDLPFLAKHLGVAVDFAVLKGRSNYLCLQRLDEALAGDRRLGLDVGGRGLDRAALAGLERFAASSATGDRSDLALDIDDRGWGQISVGRDQCPGASECPRGGDCFAERARHRAAQADIVIVNLHLYALSLVVPVILPSHDSVVIDEAHQLEEIFAEALGRSLTPARFTALARAAGALLDDRRSVDPVGEIAQMLHHPLEPLIGERLRDGPGEELSAVMDMATGRMSRLSDDLRSLAEDASPDVAVPARRARQSAMSLLDDVASLRVPGADDVVWVDGPQRNPALRTTPLRIDGLLAESLWSKRSAALTSATVPLGLPPRLGLPDDTVEIDVGSPFDYESNALLYCPAGLPDPRERGAESVRLEELSMLMDAAGGRTLALFTSHAAMQAAAGALADRFPWPLLVQGSKSKAALLAQFADDEEASLFATISFWQGIDIPGPACSLVAIDRLPFPRPDQPVLQARRDLAGRGAFRQIDLPHAAMLLAQGAGRLIRTATDQGVVAVLDPRLAESGYRRDLLAALPPMRRTRSRQEAVSLLRSLRAD